MKYEISFSCGHTETRQLVGKHTDRERKIQWFGEEGLCSACYRAKRAAEIAERYDEVTMPYREYKNGAYQDCNTKPDSFDPKAKTIVVYVPKNEKENKQ